MSRERWGAVEALLDRYGIKPIVAVIPNNRDRKMLIDPIDGGFWDKVRGWRDKGWQIALHGCTHEYVTKEGGLVPINRQSEFAGVPLDIQRKKLREGCRVFEAEGVPVSLWVAPSHSFDANTLAALRDETPIRIVSDGLTVWPFTRLGFTWIPQQLWGPIKQDRGVWTICLHPNTITSEMLGRLEGHLSRFASLFEVNIFDLASRYTDRRRSLEDLIFGWKFFARRGLSDFVRRRRFG
jgi:peptidoglycan/xylan/chitin deacetylase (PgdA/CDA1 family)